MCTSSTTRKEFIADRWLLETNLKASRPFGYLREYYTMAAFFFFFKVVHYSCMIFQMECKHENQNY